MTHSMDAFQAQQSHLFVLAQIGRSTQQRDRSSCILIKCTEIKKKIMSRPGTLKEDDLLPLKI
jgi:uncharacterized protein YjhX (UPF0386 family)